MVEDHSSMFRWHKGIDWQQEQETANVRDNTTLYDEESAFQEHSLLHKVYSK